MLSAKETLTADAATALAANSNESTRYSWIGRKVVIIPNPNMPEPIIGMIQCNFASADQPYQLNDGQRKSHEYGRRYLQESDGNEPRAKEESGNSEFWCAYTTITSGQLYWDR